MSSTSDQATPATVTGPLRVVVDRDACVGHGRCYTLAPDVWASDDEGFPELVSEQPLATAELQRQARLSVAACPERALSVEQL
jgi:ferredoxin